MENCIHKFKKKKNMKSSIHRRVRRRTTQPVTVVNDSVCFNRNKNI